MWISKLSRADIPKLRLGLQVVEVEQQDDHQVDPGCSLPNPNCKVELQELGPSLPLTEDLPGHQKLVSHEQRKEQLAQRSSTMVAELVVFVVEVVAEQLAVVVQTVKE